MLLPSIFISVVVCTVEIRELLSVFPLFICPSRPLENLSPVSRDTCDNFSHFEASFLMPQTRGSCGHIKGTYDNHLSCINCYMVVADFTVVVCATLGQTLLGIWSVGVDFTVTEQWERRKQKRRN